MSRGVSDDATKGSELLVVGRDPGARKEVAQQIASQRPGEHRVRAIAPDQLRETARWLDVLAAVVLVGPGDGAADLDLLARLRDVRCSSSILLLVDRAMDAEDTETIVSLLEPALVLDGSPSRFSLASAIDRVVPIKEQVAARKQHRSAPGLLGVSRAIREMSSHIKQISPSRIPVLILGETGTGKEVVARAVHRESGRRARPFVAINCGAFPEALLESELFGSERGAFTGATTDRPGVFEQADGGTLFLDEIGEMPLSMQVKLLRVLEDGEIRRLGATAVRKVDVRIISATHRDLEIDTEQGRFRQDLLFRLNTAQIRVPPLRRRAVDIPFLAQHFAEEFGAENARDITLSEDFITALCQHDYPGNVRELRNAVERAIAMAAPGEAIARAHLPAELDTKPRWPQAGTLKERVTQLETSVIRETLARFDGNRTRSAEALGLSRVGLRQKLKRLGLD